jgi:hypothetical protein
MATTLTYVATTLTLAEDLLWPDEYSWQAVEQRQEYTITGALIVEAAAKLSGRPMTLQAAADYGWITRDTLETLRTWALLAGQQFTLLYRGVTHTVAFDHARGAIDAQQIIDYSDPEATDDYAVTLRFLKV